MRGRRKLQYGTVISDRMDKTLSVKVERRVPHPLYGKIITHHTVLKAHDEKNEGQIGDEVEVMEVRPLSKTKRWRLVRVVKRPAKV